MKATKLGVPGMLAVILVTVAALSSCDQRGGEGRRSFGSLVQAYKDAHAREDIDALMELVHPGNGASAKMNLLAATTQNEEATNQVYNTALNDQTSLSPLYQMIEERLIERLDGLQKKEPSYRGFRAGDVRHSQAETSKALNPLGYHPSHKIAEGLDKAMDWCVNPLS